MSELMGEAEVDEKEESLSYGLSASRDGVSVFAKRNLREIVLTSEILTLPDMHGYLVIPGDYPIGQVEYNYVPSQKIAEGFIERVGFNISFNNAGMTSSGVKPFNGNVDLNAGEVSNVGQVEFEEKASSLADAL